MHPKTKRMTPRGVSKNARAESVVLDKASYTRSEFCARNGMSRGTYLHLQERGLGPREMRPTGVPGGLVLISRQAELDWIADCEARAAKMNVLAEVDRANAEAATLHAG